MTSSLRALLEGAVDYAGLFPPAKLPLDQAIRIIRNSSGKPDAAEKLKSTFKLDDEQVTAILDAQLYKIAQMEIKKILDELKEKAAQAKRIEKVLASEKELWGVVKTELAEVGEKFGDRRRTKMGAADETADFDPEAYIGQTHVTPPEREALAQLASAKGLRDVIRERWPEERVFTYWDYRAGMFHQDLGMRIDLVLASDPVAERVKAAWIDRQARKGKGPSDHAPVIVDLDEAPDGEDIGPVVPPPSAPVTKRGAKKLPQAP